MNLSGSLLIWTLGQQSLEFYEKLENTYIGCIEWEGTDTWGEYLYVETKEDYSPVLLSKLRKHYMYSADFYTEDGTFIMVFKFTPEQQDTIVKPFIAGKYSQIDREYVAKHFKAAVPGGNPSTNYQILTKDDELRAHWERELNVTPYIRIYIPEGAEVWSKIKKEYEVHGYQKHFQSQEETLESV